MYSNRIVHNVLKANDLPMEICSTVVGGSDIGWEIFVPFCFFHVLNDSFVILSARPCPMTKDWICCPSLEVVLLEGKLELLCKRDLVSIPCVPMHCACVPVH